MRDKPDPRPSVSGIADRGFFTSPFLQRGTAVYITVVAVVYSLVLRQLWNPEGAQKLADVLLHDAVPLLYIGFWGTSLPKECLRYGDAAWWLAYLAWALTGGAATGTYPIVH